MKQLFFICSILLSIFSVTAQDITGSWHGVLNVSGSKLRLVFNISKTESGLKATMDSPDQGAKGIPMTSAVLENGFLTLTLDAANIKMTCLVVSNEMLSGKFNQMGQELPITLSRKEIVQEKPKRPQEPLPPYPYKSENISFFNQKDSITLAGTITIPQNPGVYPAVVLISGSGPQNRDEELLGHKPFLVIADYLTRNGIIVLRFDDRGTNKSEGNFQLATSNDFATDVKAAVQYLKTRNEVNIKKIGLIGHSEGGIIAPMVASEDKSLNFIILLAGTSVTGAEIMLNQQELIGKANGMKEDDIQTTKEINTLVFNMIIDNSDTESLKAQIKEYLLSKSNEIPGLTIPEGSSAEKIIELQLNQTVSPWMLNFIRYNPSKTLAKLKIPVLALFGEKDLQVSPELNIPPMREAFNKAGNKKAEIVNFPGLNHLFQECKNGSPNEYASIEQTISPVVLQKITEWIKKTTE